MSMVGSIGRGAGIGALSNGVSNMCVTTIDYLAEHGNLNGALDDIAISGFSGVVSGGILGGITGGFIHVKSQLQVSNSKYLKPDGKIDWDKYAPNNGRINESVLKNQTIKQGSMIVLAPMSNICAFSFSVRLRKLSNSAI